MTRLLGKRGRISKRRVIDVLREQYPGKWSYSHSDFMWIGPEFNVRAYSAWTPMYDGDDDTFTTEYRRDDTHERLFL